MPVLINSADPNVQASFTHDEAKAALASGQWKLPTGQGLAVEDVVTGRQTEVPHEELARTSPDVYAAGDDTARFRGALGAAEHSAYSGMGDQLLAAGEGAAGVLTLGGSDLALDALGADTALRAKHATVGRTIGEVGATIATAVSPFGKGGLAKALSITPGGAASKFGAGGVGALARVARTAGEGAAYGVGQAVSNIALAEPGMTSEQMVSQLGQGALLGAALGGTAGAIGVGAGKWADRALAKRVANPLDLRTGPAREALDRMSKAHNTVDEFVDIAIDEGTKTAQSAGTLLRQEWSANLRKQVDEIGQSFAPVKAFEDDVATGLTRMRDAVIAGPSLQVATELAGLVNKVAPTVGLKGLTKSTVTKLRGKILAGTDVSAELAKLTAKVDEVLAKQIAGKGDEVGADLLGKVATDDDARKVLHHAAASADPAVAKRGLDALELLKQDSKIIDDAVEGMTPAAFDRSEVRKMFTLRPDEGIDAAAFERIIRGKPEDLLAKATQLDEYYKAARQATANNGIASSRVGEAMAEYTAALDALVPAEAQKILVGPQLMQILGVEAAVDYVVPDGPAKTMLQLAAGFKMLSGVTGIRGAGRSVFRRVANSISRRAMAGAGSGAMRMLPAVKNAGPVMGTAAVGAGASAGFEFAAWTQKTFFNGAKGAMNATAQANATIGAAAQRLAQGNPIKARAMPALNQVMDKLLGDPEHEKKSPQEKFKVVQDRLTKYAVAPDAALNALYEFIRPIQEISEELADLMESVLGVQLSYLQTKLPLDPGTMMMFGKSMWKPTDRELYEFSLSAMGVLYPLDAVDMIADGCAPPQVAEALAATNPEIFAKMQMSIIERADEIRENSTYPQRISLGLAFQLPLDPTSDPRYVAFMQNMHAQKTMEQAAGKAGDSSTPEESYSDAQKLLS